MHTTELYSFLASSANAAVCLANTTLLLLAVMHVLLAGCLTGMLKRQVWVLLKAMHLPSAWMAVSSGKTFVQSHKAQLKAAILGVQSDPHLAIEHAVSVYHHSTGQPYLEELGFLDYNAGRACLQRSDSCIFFANGTFDDLAQALTTVTRLLTEKRTKHHIGHVLIMPCWNDHDRQFSREDVEHACQSVLNNKWTRHDIYSTAPLVQCIKLARQSSPASMSTDSDNDSDVGNPGHVSQLLLPPILVVAILSVGSQLPPRTLNILID